MAESGASCIKNVEFVKSVYSINDLPEELPVEIAFAGRSNVGKSSLLNAIFGRRKYVKVSSRPGFTQALNFFLINKSAYFVDLPGYGYAKAPKKVIEKWQKLIERYLTTRENLRGVVCIFDIRRGVNELDIGLLNYLKSLGVEPFVVFNKADKLSNNKIKANLERAKLLMPSLSQGPYVLSAKTKKGLAPFLNEVICPLVTPESEDTPLGQ